MKKIIITLLIIIFIFGCQKVQKSIVEPEKIPEGGVEMAKKVLLIVAQKDFQPVEYADTRAELEKAGIKVDVASINTGTAVAANGNRITVDFAVRDVSVDDYSAIVLIGGPGAPVLGEYDEVLELIRDSVQKNKVTAAICISPTILAKAGVLEGKKATVWSSLTDKSPIEKLKSGGANYVDSSVVQDGHIITANGPAAAKDFGRKIAATLR